MRPHLIRAAALAVILALLTAACGTAASTDPAAEPAGDETAAAGSEATGGPSEDGSAVDLPAGWSDAIDELRCQDATVGSFPRTVDNADGSTTIDREPTRVVSIEGTSSLDLLLLMGVTPVAAGGDGDDGQLLPWQAYLAGGTPDDPDGIELITKRPEVNVEQLVAADPDLVISQTGWISEIRDEIEALDVPVVTFEWGDTDEPTLPRWREVVRIVGEAVGRDGCIDEIVETVEAAAAEIGDELQAQVGDATMSTFYTFPDYHAINGEVHPTTAFLTDELGLEVVAPDGVEFEEFTPETPEVVEADHMLLIDFENDELEGSYAQEFASQPAVEALDGELHHVPSPAASASYYPSALGLRLFAEWLRDELS